MWGGSSGESSVRSPRWPARQWRYWPVFCAALIASPLQAEVLLTDAEAEELDRTLQTLEARLIEQDAQLIEARKEIETVKHSLEEAGKSYEAREREWAEGLRKRTAERDGWMVTAAATGVAGILALIVCMVLRL